ncbi:MAG: hypothetical protein ACRDO1_04255 [Nocardioidaceae bacterium]
MPPTQTAGPATSTFPGLSPVLLSTGLPVTSPSTDGLCAVCFAAWPFVTCRA